MAFGDPFAGNVNRKMSKEELIQALRLDISGELKAIYIYEAHYLATDDLCPRRSLAIYAMKKGPHRQADDAFAVS